MISGRHTHRGQPVRLPSDSSGSAAVDQTGNFKENSGKRPKKSGGKERKSTKPERPFFKRPLLPEKKRTFYSVDYLVIKKINEKCLIKDILIDLIRGN